MKNCHDLLHWSSVNNHVAVKHMLLWPERWLCPDCPKTYDCYEPKTFVEHMRQIHNDTISGPNKNRHVPASWDSLEGADEAFRYTRDLAFPKKDRDAAMASSKGKAKKAKKNPQPRINQEEQRLTELNMIDIVHEADRELSDEAKRRDNLFQTYFTVTKLNWPNPPPEFNDMEAKVNRKAIIKAIRALVTIGGEENLEKLLMLRNSAQETQLNQNFKYLGSWTTKSQNLERIKYLEKAIYILLADDITRLEELENSRIPNDSQQSSLDDSTLSAISDEEGEEHPDLAGILPKKK